MTASPVTTRPERVDICGHCGKEVRWSECAQRGATYNPPSVNHVQRLTHRTCSEAASEAWRRNQDDDDALERWRGGALT